MLVAPLVELAPSRAASRSFQLSKTAALSNNSMSLQLSPRAPEHQPLLAATAAGTLPAAVAAGVQGPATTAAGTACTLDRQWPKVAAIIAPVLLANISIRNPPILLFIRA